MAFDQSAFIIAGTAIAIAGVGLYIWDTRGKDLLSSSNSSTMQYNQGYNGNSRGESYFGGRRYSRKYKRNQGRKTKRH